LHGIHILAKERARRKNTFSDPHPRLGEAGPDRMSLWIPRGVAMRKLVRILGIAAVMGLGTWLFTGAGTGADNGDNMIWKPVISEDDGLKLAKRSVEIIQKSVEQLSKPQNPKLTKPQIYAIKKRILVNAGLLAVYAKSAKGGANKQELITLAELGLKLNKIAQDRSTKPAVLGKLANELAKAKVNAKAKLDTVPWSEMFEDQGYVMTPFKVWKKGGNGLPEVLRIGKLKKDEWNGIEEKVKALWKTKADLKKQGPEIALMAAQIAATAQLTDELPPVKQKEGDKDPKEWKKWSEDMRKFALELAAAAKKGDAAEVKKAAKRLDDNCTACHKIFKTND
jgi:cytochrome c556